MAGSAIEFGRAIASATRLDLNGLCEEVPEQHPPASGPQVDHDNERPERMRM